MDVGIRVEGGKFAHQHVPLLGQHVLEHLRGGLFLVRRILLTVPPVHFTHVDGALPRPRPVTALYRGGVQVLPAAHGTAGVAGHHAGGEISDTSSFIDLLRPVVRVGDLHQLKHGGHSSQAKVGIRVIQSMGHGLDALGHSLEHWLRNAL